MGKLSFNLLYSCFGYIALFYTHALNVKRIDVVFLDGSFWKALVEMEVCGA